MGRHRQDGYATLGAISSVAAPGATSQETRLPLQELRAEGEHLYEVEGILFGSRSQSSRDHGRKLRGILLYMFQSGRWHRERDLFPREKREVSPVLSTDPLRFLSLTARRYQKLELSHVETMGCYASMEFR